MLQCIKTGRNPTMRHLARTHRVSVGWIHEQYMSGQFIFAHESGERMPPDIFTKMFSDKSKWLAARMLINIVLPEELDKVMEQSKEIFQGIQEKPALPSSAEKSEEQKKRRRKRRGGTSAAALSSPSATGGPANEEVAISAAPVVPFGTSGGGNGGNAGLPPNGGTSLALLGRRGGDRKFS